MNPLPEINESNFTREVMESTVPVIVDFWAPWCGPCKMIAPILAEIAETNAGRIKVVKVNLDENPALALAHNVQSIPTLLYVIDGSIRARSIGAASKRTILTKLDEVLMPVA